MRRSFEKIEGLGNDFIVVDAAHWPLDQCIPARVHALCDRHTGIGADGVIWVDTTTQKMIVFNADGSRPEMCGNGARCVVAFLAARGVTPDVLLTDAGPRSVRLVDTQTSRFQVEIEMGIVRCLPAVEVSTHAALRAVWPVNVGNPHAVVMLDREIAVDLAEDFARQIRARTDIWPHGANVEFVVPNGPNAHVTVHERGVGWTRACGTGACAVGVVMHMLHGARPLSPRGARPLSPRGARPRSTVQVTLPGGTLDINVLSVSNEQFNVVMTGPARRVFTGEIDPINLEGTLMDPSRRDALSHDERLADRLSTTPGAIA